jgi:hypothetical protein
MLWRKGKRGEERRAQSMYAARPTRPASAAALDATKALFAAPVAVGSAGDVVLASAGAPGDVDGPLADATGDVGLSVGMVTVPLV